MEDWKMEFLIWKFVLQIIKAGFYLVVNGVKLFRFVYVDFIQGLFARQTGAKSTKCYGACNHLNIDENLQSCGDL
jgi:uncharacterized protein YqgC (DUF456 family)